MWFCVYGVDVAYPTPHRTHVVIECEPRETNKNNDAEACRVYHTHTLRCEQCVTHTPTSKLNFYDSVCISRTTHAHRDDNEPCAAYAHVFMTYRFLPDARAHAAMHSGANACVHTHTHKHTGAHLRSQTLILGATGKIDRGGRFGVAQRVKRRGNGLRDFVVKLCELAAGIFPLYRFKKHTHTHTNEKKRIEM